MFLLHDERRCFSATSTLAAVDVRDLSRDEWCGFKEENRVRDIAHLAYATQRMKSAEYLSCTLAIGYSQQVSRFRRPGELQRRRSRKPQLSRKMQAESVEGSWPAVSIMTLCLEQ